MLSTGRVSKVYYTGQYSRADNPTEIRTAILNGDIDRALKYLKSFYPHVLESDRNRDIYFKLRCRKFIEMMRRCNDLQTGASSQAMTDSTTSITSNGHTETKDDEADAGVFDHQMELDDQVQRESHAPSLEPVSIPPPLSTFDSPAPSDDPAESEAMDTTPDPAPTQPQPQPQPQDTKSSAMRHKQLLDKAIAYGQELQAEFSGDARSNYRKVLQDAFALLAYTDARGSVVGGLMEGRGRVEIAEEVNGAVMRTCFPSIHPPSSFPNPLYQILLTGRETSELTTSHRIPRQTALSGHREMRRADGGAARYGAGERRRGRPRRSQGLPQIVC